MTKHKYIYNPNTLNYEKINLTFKDQVKRLLSFLTSGLVFASIILFVAYAFFDSPKEIALKRENEQLRLQYSLINSEVEQIEQVMDNIINRDNNIYRVIFEVDPIPENIRKAGVGGVNRYKALEGFQFSDLVIESKKRIDNLSKQLYIQSKSFDEVIELAIQKEEMLASIPAIQPITNDKDLARFSSGYGYRTDPKYKTIKMHSGVDFSAPIGTPIYATGDGVVSKVVKRNRGYGYHVKLKHNFGYETLYAHMSKINVMKGQKVKRGDVIGYVGNTGKSTGPHLHYEVIKDNKKINPINFFHNDLTPEEFDRMIEISSQPRQSFD